MSTTRKTTASTSTSKSEGQQAQPAGVEAISWPTEAEIFILPNGEVIFADLPGELTRLVQRLGPIEP